MTVVEKLCLSPQADSRVVIWSRNLPVTANIGRPASVAVMVTVCASEPSSEFSPSDTCTSLFCSDVQFGRCTHVALPSGTTPPKPWCSAQRKGVARWRPRRFWDLNSPLSLRRRQPAEGSSRPTCSPAAELRLPKSDMPSYGRDCMNFIKLTTRRRWLTCKGPERKSVLHALTPGPLIHLHRRRSQVANRLQMQVRA